ncbi:hypothetical protein LIER_03820 [Lithospermum erythrorhizon]|uniref:F-box associated domain-containing protein n=1 Tax=Lithospermum erythrorhizon TaxID=34254 RepID=A0AAV3NUK3_LITER
MLFNNFSKDSIFIPDEVIQQIDVYYVCNPMTKEFKLLPRSRERPIIRFYPDNEATLVGLAYNLETQKYNVVLAGYHRSFGHRQERNFIRLIYDSVSNKWRKFVTLQDDHFTHMNRNQVVFIKNALLWLTESYSCILFLDLDCDVRRKIYLLFEERCGGGSRDYLLESDGCLSIIQIDEAWMNIWVMKSYEKEHWQLVDKVSLRCIRVMVPGIFPISQSGEYVFLATYKQVLVYQQNRKVWKEIYSIKNSSTLPLWFSTHSFRSTLNSCR